MPCSSDGYSEPRGMDPSEVWKSFSRHHRVLELETEALRRWAKAVEKKHKELKSILPGLKLDDLPPFPMETPVWVGVTYRDGKGKFPNDIRKYLDWLSDEDFK